VISDVFPYCGLTVDAIKYDGSDTAKAWLKHPANQIQLVSLQGAYDFDGDGVTSKDEFRKLFKATGSNANADLIFDQLDTDRSGFLTQAEIKALGQDRTGKGARRDGGRLLSPGGKAAQKAATSVTRMRTQHWTVVGSPAYNDQALDATSCVYK
jgi:hypothetical protein